VVGKTLLAPLLGCVVLGGCAAAVPAVDQPQPSVITVTAMGRVAVRPDVVLVTLGAETRASTLAEATADVGRRMGEALARVKALGVAENDITTVVYAVDPIAAPRRSDDEAPRIVGYRVANVVRLRLRDLAAAGRIVDAAIAAGANTVSALQFTLDGPARAESEARVFAVRAAAAKAREIADSAGVRLGELVWISESAPIRPVPRAAMATQVAPGPVEPGQLEIVVGIEARYRIAPR